MKHWNNLIGLKLCSALQLSQNRLSTSAKATKNSADSVQKTQEKINRTAKIKIESVHEQQSRERFKPKGKDYEQNE